MSSGVVVASQRLGEENQLTGQAYHNLGLAHAKRKCATVLVPMQCYAASEA